MNIEERIEATKQIPLKVRQDRLKKHLCLNCGEKGPHFVPPSLGDKGFFMCEAKP